MEDCKECPEGDAVTQAPGVGLKFDDAANMVYLGVFMQEGSASIGLSLEETRHFKDNLDKVILEAEAYNAGLNSGEETTLDN